MPTPFDLRFSRNRVYFFFLIGGKSLNIFAAALLILRSRAGLPAPPELPDEARRAVAANLDAFNRANPLNYLWVGVLVRLLRDEQPHGQDAGEPARLLGADAALAGEFGPVPPIVDVDDMSPEIRAKVMDLADLGLGKTDRIVPSLYRHVVHRIRCATATGRLEGRQRRRSTPPGCPAPCRSGSS